MGEASSLQSSTFPRAADSGRSWANPERQGRCQQMRYKQCGRLPEEIAEKINNDRGKVPNGLHAHSTARTQPFAMQGSRIVSKRYWVV